MHGIDVVHERPTVHLSKMTPEPCSMVEFYELLEECTVSIFRVEASNHQKHYLTAGCINRWQCCGLT
jgi:hypothetical protein